jgi:hypothetical protein
MSGCRPISIATDGYLTGGGGFVLSSAASGYLTIISIPVSIPSGFGGGVSYRTGERRRWGARRSRYTQPDSPNLDQYYLRSSEEKQKVDKRDDILMDDTIINKLLKIDFKCPKSELDFVIKEENKSNKD